MGEDLLHNFMNFNEPQITSDEIFDEINNIEPETLTGKEMFVKRFLLGDSSSGIYRYKTIKFCWHLNSQDFKPIQKLQRFRTKIWKGIVFKKNVVRKTSQVYRVPVSRNKT